MLDALYGLLGALLGLWVLRLVGGRLVLLAVRRALRESAGVDVTVRRVRLRPTAQLPVLALRLEGIACVQDRRDPAKGPGGDIRLRFDRIRVRFNPVAWRTQPISLLSLDGGALVVSGSGGAVSAPAGEPDAPTPTPAPDRAKPSPDPSVALNPRVTRWIPGRVQLRGFRLVVDDPNPSDGLELDGLEIRLATSAAVSTALARDGRVGLQVHSAVQKAQLGPAGFTDVALSGRLDVQAHGAEISLQTSDTELHFNGLTASLGGQARWSSPGTHTGELRARLGPGPLSGLRSLIPPDPPHQQADACLEGELELKYQLNWARPAVPPREKLQLTMRRVKAKWPDRPRQFKNLSVTLTQTATYQDAAGAAAREARVVLKGDLDLDQQIRRPEALDAAGEQVVAWLTELLPLAVFDHPSPTCGRRAQK